MYTAEKTVEQMKDEIIGKYGFEAKETVVFFSICEKQDIHKIAVVHYTFMSEEYDRVREKYMED